MKRKNTKRAVAAVMLSAVIMFAASCQLITAVDSTSGSNIVISKDPIVSSAEPTAETTETAQTAATEPTAATETTAAEVAPLGPTYINPLTKKARHFTRLVEY